LPERDNIDAPLVNILAIECHCSFHPRVGDEFVQAVERSKEGRFSTSRRADQGSDLALFDDDVNILQGVIRPIIEV
jgi:hypothetical protein